MKKNILIVGSSGSIGHEFTKHYDLERNVEKIFEHLLTNIVLQN